MKLVFWYAPASPLSPICETHVADTQHETHEANETKTAKVTLSRQMLPVAHVTFQRIIVATITTQNNTSTDLMYEVSWFICRKKITVAQLKTGKSKELSKGR